MAKEYNIDDILSEVKKRREENERSILEKQESEAETPDEQPDDEEQEFGVIIEEPVKTQETKFPKKPLYKRTKSLLLNRTSPNKRPNKRRSRRMKPTLHSKNLRRRAKKTALLTLIQFHSRVFRQSHSKTTFRTSRRKKKRK